MRALAGRRAGGPPPSTVAARRGPRVALVRHSSTHRWVQLGVLAAAAVLTLFVANTVADYRLLLFSRVLAFVVALLGLNLVTGLSGQLSIGHNAFMGMGAYTSAILVTDHGWPWLATLVPSLLVGFVGGLVLSIPAMRVRGLYLALVTLSFGVLFPTLVRRFASLTGGSNGKMVSASWRTPSWFPLEVSNAGWRLIVLFVIAAVAYWVATSVMHSVAGRGLIALRDNEMAATTCGVNLRRDRVVILAVSAAYGAIAGSMITLVVPVVSPDGYGFGMAVQLITGLVVGGMTRLGGAVLGALLVVWLPYYATGWSANLPLLTSSDAIILSNAIYGVVLIVITFAMPGGLAAGMDKLFGRLVRVFPIAPLASPPVPAARVAEELPSGPTAER